MQARKLLLVGGSGAAVLAVGLASAALAGAQGTPPPQAPLSPAQAQSLSTNVTQRVIVVMRNQLPGVSAAPASLPTREADIQQVQQPVISQLDQTNAQDVQSYTTVDAVSATVSPGEETLLQSNPAVSAVIPDALIPLGTPSATAAQVASSVGATPLPGACAPPGQVQLTPQALQTIGADSQNAAQPTARSLGITGAGVTVAFIADGLDINNPDFIRANGQHVFVDYKDFSGEGTSVPTGGGEAFLDASSVAAQGREVYDVSHYSDLPLNRPCLIRVEGVAPGASLVGLDIFGAEDAGYSSSFLQAIDYAVTVDHVNVLNESLGSNAYPDDGAALNLIQQANDEAVAAGTTVVVSSGDAGVTSTIGTPATDSNVISAGASTTYQIDAETGYGGARFPGVDGWLNNNISSFSSAGFTQKGATVTLVAPGELNWALCSTDVAMYSDCTNYAGNPTPVQATGGTSESAPLTAGVAALVIQAYARTHHGSLPTPAVVKQILTSTADDIGAPADQQGSGLVDAYRAVLAAEAYGQPSSAAPDTPGTLLESTNQFNVSAAPGSPEQLTDTITNNGSRPQTVSLSTRAIGPYSTIRSATVNLADGGPHTTDWQGITDNVQSVSFVVPAGANRLNAAIAFQNASPTDLTARVRMTLVDANGDLAGYSVPQGDGNYGDLQVTDPVPGHWTAYIYSRDSADGGTTGPVVFGASVAAYTQFGSVHPSTLVLGPGQSAPVTLTVAVPTTPGDSAGALLLSARGAPSGFFSSPSSAAATVTTVPVTLRSLVPTGPVSFQGVLTGGNGRQSNDGQTFYYQLNVPAGQPELNATVTLSSNPDNQMYAWLVDPSGDAVSFASNGVVTTDNSGNVTYTNTLGANLHALAPATGTWTLIVLFAPQVSGTALSDPFTVATNETAVSASAPGLPNSAQIILKSGTPVTVPVSVHNSGTAPEAYFLDGRLSSSTQYDLAALTGSSTTVPLNLSENFPFYIVPSDTTTLNAVAQTTGTEPIQFDFGAYAGDPDLASSVGLSAAGSYSANPVTPGPWYLAPTTVGPFGATGATPENVDTALLATTLAFDPAISSPLGDLWQSAINPNAAFGAVIVNPGQTTTINVTITPAGAKGSVVSGTLFVDDESLVDFDSLVPDANQLAAFPYSYKIG
jgi:hypothetical protein